MGCTIWKWCLTHFNLQNHNFIWFDLIEILVISLYSLSQVLACNFVPFWGVEWRYHSDWSQEHFCERSPGYKKKLLPFVPLVSKSCICLSPQQDDILVRYDYRHMLPAQRWYSILSRNNKTDFHMEFVYIFYNLKPNEMRDYEISLTLPVPIIGYLVAKWQYQCSFLLRDPLSRIINNKINYPEEFTLFCFFVWATQYKLIKQFNCSTPQLC